MFKILTLLISFLSVNQILCDIYFERCTITPTDYRCEPSPGDGSGPGGGGSGDHDRLKGDPDAGSGGHGSNDEQEQRERTLKEEQSKRDEQEKIEREKREALGHIENALRALEGQKSGLKEDNNQLRGKLSGLENSLQSRLESTQQGFSSFTSSIEQSELTHDTIAHALQSHVESYEKNLADLNSIAELAKIKDELKVAEDAFDSYQFKSLPSPLRDGPLKTPVVFSTKRANVRPSTKEKGFEQVAFLFERLSEAREKITHLDAVEVRSAIADAAEESIRVASGYYAEGNLDYGHVASAIAYVLLDLSVSITLGWGRDIYEALVGRDLLTQEKLDTFSHSMAIFGAITGGIGSKIGKIVTVFRRLVKGEKAQEALQACQKIVDVQAQFTTTKEAAQEVAKHFGGTFKAAQGKGWIVEIPRTDRRTIVRVMDAGSGGREKPYFRVSIENKGSMTLEGELSNRADLTHIDMTDTYLEQMKQMLNKYLKN